MTETIKRLFGPAQLTAAAATKWTVPAGEKTLFRHFHFYNADVAARTVTLSVGADAAGTRVLDGFSIAAKTPYDWYCYLPLDAAEIIQAFADVTLQVTLEGSGTEYSAG
jgi:hypothetical protein